MSEEGKTPEGETPEDGVKNLKAEVNRKLENINADITNQNKEMKATLDRILSTMAPREEAPAASNQKLGELLYNDADAAARIIEERAVTAVNQRIDSNQRNQAALLSLTKEYPELTDADSDLTKKSIEIYNGLSRNLKDTSDGYEVAVRKAAAQVGVLPADKRTKKSESNDEYSTPGSSAPSNRPKGTSKDLDPRVLETAKAFGLDVTKKEVIERLKKRSQGFGG